MWDLDICIIIKQITLENKKYKFGLLFLMATTTRGSIGTFLASSFCERINSADNLVMTDNNTMLGDEKLNMMATLRMNRDFIKFMRNKFGNISINDLKKIANNSNNIN